MTFPKGKPARSPKQWQIYGGDAADALLEETDQKINALLPFSQEHPVVEDKLLAAWGVHFIQIKSYFAFYVVEGNQVTVIRFLYAKSDRVSQSIARIHLMTGDGFKIIPRNGNMHNPVIRHDNSRHAAKIGVTAFSA